MPQSDSFAEERHLLAALLIGAATFSGGHGADGLARLALLIALPLVRFASIVMLVLLSCVLRSSALGAVPRLAVSSFDVALALYAFKAAAALAPSLRQLGLRWPAKP